MPRSRPEAVFLLERCRAYLRQELMPTLSGYHLFQCRVLANVLAIVGREIELGAALDAAELARLSALLGEAGLGEAGLGEEGLGEESDSADLERRLAEALRRGEIALSTPGLLEHLGQSAADALRINNPGWLEEEDRA